MNNTATVSALDMPDHFPLSGKVPLQSVVFDWSGVLLDFGQQAPNAAWQRVFEQRGVPIDPTQFKLDPTDPPHTQLDVIVNLDPIFERWQQVRSEPLDPATQALLLDEHQSARIKVLAEQTSLVRGASQCIEQLRSKSFNLGGNSHYDHEMTQAMLREAMIQGLQLDTTVGADDISSHPPQAPFRLLQHLTSMATWPTSALVVVSADPAWLKQGLELGCWCIAVSASGRGCGITEEQWLALDDHQRRQSVAAPEQAFERIGVHFIIDTVADVCRCIEQIESIISLNETPGE